MQQELSRHRGGARTDLYAVHREGAGHVLLIGPPNAGKSSLLESLTGAAARVAEYAFTTSRRSRRWRRAPAPGVARSFGSGSHFHNVRQGSGGATVEDLADMIHHELRQKLTYAVRWPEEGSPLRVAHDYVLHDRDVIEIHAG